MLNHQRIKNIIEALETNMNEAWIRSIHIFLSSLKISQTWLNSSFNNLRVLYILSMRLHY